jgi:hypothetical protein
MVCAHNEMIQVSMSMLDKAGNEASVVSAILKFFSFLSGIESARFLLSSTVVMTALFD